MIQKKYVENSISMIVTTEMYFFRFEELIQTIFTVLRIRLSIADFYGIFKFSQTKEIFLYFK